MSTPDRSPALAALDVLVGEWTVRPAPPPEWGVTDLDSLTGGVEAVARAGSGVQLNATLHANE